MASSVHGSDVSDVIPQAPAAPAAAAAAAAQLTPTAKDVARRHRRWNTGSTALDSTLQARLEIFITAEALPLCSPHSQLLRASR